MIDLNERVVVISGASRGIGSEAAKLCARAGARVVVNYLRDSNAADQVIRTIEAAGGKAMAFQADVSDPAQVEGMVEGVLGRWGRIDVLVNNAGIWTYGAIAEMADEIWRETMRVNLDSVYYCCRRVVPHMQKQGGGRIINISSTAGQRGEAYHSHYAATKGAIISFTKSLAAELASDNILVNAVAPGWAVTDMTTEALRDEAEQIFRNIPLGRAGSAVEMAGAILFLASDLASYITGEIINVNGGSVLCG